jgi:hypothetical protein
VGWDPQYLPGFTPEYSLKIAAYIGSAGRNIEPRDDTIKVKKGRLQGAAPSLMAC